jgi:hypothetical protein
MYSVVVVEPVEQVPLVMQEYRQTVVLVLLIRYLDLLLVSYLQINIG